MLCVMCANHLLNKCFIALIIVLSLKIILADGWLTPPLCQRLFIIYYFRYHIISVDKVSTSLNTQTYIDISNGIDGVIDRFH